MERTRRHGIYYVGTLLFSLLLYTVLYKFGMAVFEGADRSFLAALEVVVQSMTTTGFGQDAAIWSTTPVLALVIVMQATGVFFVFLTLPLFVVPWIQHRLEPTVPDRFDGADHVLVCGYSSLGGELVEELDSHGLRTVVLLDDLDLARDLTEQGQEVVRGDAESVSVLEAASVEDARAVVLDESDERNANVALAVRELTDTVDVAAFVHDPERRTYLELAGVDAPLNPRKIVGNALAKEVSRVIDARLESAIEVHPDLQVIEFPVPHGSSLVGRSLATAGIREQTGANVIGAWIDGDFVPNPAADSELDARTTLVVSGTEEQLQALVDLAVPEATPRGTEAVMIGYGNTGQEVCRALEVAQVDCTVIDLDDREGVDIVGDATEEPTLAAANLENANALIVTVGDDTEATFITLLARDRNPDLEIVVRAEDADNRSKLIAAGADYVLPIETVSARMLAGTITGDEVLSYETRIEILRTETPAFEGLTVGEAAVGERTGCTILAVDRDGETYTGIDADFEIRPGDEVVVAGTEDDVDQFRDLAGA